MAKKQKLPTLTTPPGEALWPRLNEPDTKFKKEGEYSVKLAFDPTNDRVKPFVARIEELVDEAFEKAKDENPKYRKGLTRVSPVTPELDDQGEETGRVVINCKRLASTTSKQDGKTYTFRVARYDATGRPLSADVKIGGGSILRANIEISPYFSPPKPGAKAVAGVSIRLQAVQVIELKEWKQRDAASYGFEKEEGYDSTVASESEEQDEFEEQSEETGSDDEEQDDAEEQGEDEEQEEETLKKVEKLATSGSAKGKKAAPKKGQKDDF